MPPVEVRQYDPYLIAEVTFSKEEAPDMKAALSGGFRNIAAYIFDSKVRSLVNFANTLSMTPAAKCHLRHAPLHIFGRRCP